MLVASVFAAYGQNLNEETKFFDNPCLRPNDGCGCACISGGYFGNFCFGDLAGTRLPCPVPWNQGNKLCPCMICCVIWQLANICCWWGIKVWAAWLQKCCKHLFSVFWDPACFMHPATKKKDLLAIWIDAGIAIAKGVLRAEKLLAKIHHLTAEAKINLLIASWCCYTVNATA